MGILSFFRNLKGKKSLPRRELVMRAFKRRYVSFKELLQSNTELADILAAIDAALHGGAPLSESRIRADAARAVFHTMRMAAALNAISGDRHAALISMVEAINERIMAELDDAPPPDVPDLTLPLRGLRASDRAAVGGKCANLGEIAGLGLPVPRGFAVTTTACAAFLGKEMLEEIRKLLRHADAARPHTITDVAEDIERLLAAAPLPESVEAALTARWDETFGEDAPHTSAALRSSAAAEDGADSFAGQYVTVLGVARNTLNQAFRAVAAGLFSPRAIAYCLRHGYLCGDIGMGMCCLEMVDAAAAGIVFSRHPVELLSDAVVVQGVWGLGEPLADGEVKPDQWLIRREGLDIVQMSVACKDTLLRLESGPDGLRPRKRETPPETREIPCLTDAQARHAAALALQLERHCRRPQDVEWALDARGHMLLLQSRPMRLPEGHAAEQTARAPAFDAPVLLEGGDIAAKGVACGPVFHVENAKDLEIFPAGAVLVTRHSSPKIAAAMDRAAAVVAETGSLTGHMASVCREFRLPTLLNVKGALALPQNATVTVDALNGRVYAGEVPDALALGEAPAPVETSPVRLLLRRVARHITPLHLIDAKSAMFAPEHCASLHDVMRFAHEQSYEEMFQLSDSASDMGAAASRLRCSVPLDLHVIDLGDGLKNPEARNVFPEDVLSVPFRAVLNGMLRPEVLAGKPRPIDMQGFLSVMSQTMIGGNNHGGERFGDRSYAIVSDRYCNFSSRVGYHYAILDSWCGDTMNKNYVTFKFSGGAAGETRRIRRARCIGLILQELGFTVDVTRDRVQARFQKYPRRDTEERLDQLGRLLIVTRQMDMLMVGDESMRLFADKFLRGEYH